MRRLDNSKSEGIRADLRNGMSTRSIAAKYYVSQSTVTRLRRTLPDIIPRLKAGRPGKVTPTSRRLMVRSVTNGLLENAIEVQRFLQEQLNINISVNRVREILREENLCGQKKVRKPKLTPSHRKQRREFVARYLHWSISDWKRVLWSDETKINRYGSDGTRWVWRNNNIGIQARLVEETLKHGGGSLMMWGCMHWLGAGYISHIEAGLDARLYTEILDECVPLTLEYYNINAGDMIFQQDNDPKHTARLTKRFFEDHRYNLLFWPANSPDMNPIEHLWGHVKRRLARYPQPPKGIHELWERIQEVWNSITPDVCQNLIASMPRRLQALRKARGGHTKY